MGSTTATANSTFIVRPGQRVNHDGKLYVEGQSIPLTLEQAAAISHAVESGASSVQYGDVDEPKSKTKQ